MNNYQLYRTNVLLGGQMKWDIIVDNFKNTLCVSDYHLTPISNNIPCMRMSDEYLIKNKHQDNVKEYFKNNKGHFYKDGINGEFKHNWPIVTDDTEKIYSNMYDAGCKRMQSFKLYNKQFELFCPVWLENLSDDISFVISILTDSYQTIAKNTLTLSPVGSSYHDKFVQYFKNYINDTGIDRGNDDVFNVSFDTNTATMNGLNVSSGIIESINCNDVIQNLISRERSLIETDSILVSAMVDNTIVCKQLFNFNICFNLDDIMSGSVVNMIHGESIIISVDVKIGDTFLEKRDFYTEYEFIPKDVMTRGTININNIDTNVLNYLHDYKCVDLINKNKFCQSICHWSLVDNNEYIFNIYDGFSGLYIEENADKSLNIFENEHQYGLTPNLHIKTYDKNQNSTGWFFNYETQYWNDFYKYIKNTDKYKKLGTHIVRNTFINNVKYHNIPDFNGFPDGIYLIGLCVNTDLLINIKSSIENCYDILGDESVYAILKDDMLLLLTTDYDNFSFGKFYDILHDVVGKPTSNLVIKNILISLYKMLNNKVEPSLIPFNKSLKFLPASSPNINSAEIDYVKTDEFNYVIRYDGKIKPSFVNDNNSLYYKDSIAENNLPNSTYSLYNNSDYEPLYPSINYCAIKKLDKSEWSYQNIYTTHKYEYSWFDNSKCIVISPSISFTFTNTKADGYENTDIIISDYLRRFYNVNDENMLTYIKSLYNYTNNWEYLSDTNVNDYIYNIQLTLK